MSTAECGIVWDKGDNQWLCCRIAKGIASMTNEQTAVLLMNVVGRISLEIVLLRYWLEKDEIDTKDKGWFIQLENLCDDLHDQAKILIDGSSLTTIATDRKQRDGGS